MVSPVSTFSHSGERVPLIHDANNNNIKSDEEEAKNDDAKMKTTTFTTAFAFVAFLSACAFAVSSLRGGKGSSGVSLLGSSSSRSQSAKETITLVTGCSPRDLIYSLDFDPSTWTGKVGAKLITSGMSSEFL